MPYVITAAASIISGPLIQETAGTRIPLNSYYSDNLYSHLIGEQKLNIPKVPNQKTNL